MHIEIRPSSTGMTRARSRELALRLKAAFARMTHLISRVVVRVDDATRNGSTTRECTVEIHLPNGEVTVINERQRKLGALVRRATERAWKAATQAVGLPPGGPTASLGNRSPEGRGRVIAAAPLSPRAAAGAVARG